MNVYPDLSEPIAELLRIANEKGISIVLLKAALALGSIQMMTPQEFEANYQAEYSTMR
jgi:hypothetical protein